jgi:probable HAF family extracellular repeat protein
LTLALRCVAICAAVLGAARIGYAQGPPYSFVRLQYPDALVTEAHGVNNSGHVVGTYYSQDGKPHGFKYDGVNYTTVDFPGAPFNYVFGVNAAGDMVGGYSTQTGIGPYHGFLFKAGTGSFSTVDFPGQETDGRAINSSGTIVGIYDAAFGQPDHGWSKIGDTFESIDVDGARHTYVFGINDAGRISGTYADSNGRLHGWRRTGSTFSFIDFPGAYNTLVGGTNNSDTVVGWADLATKRSGFVLSGLSFRVFDAAFPGVTATMPGAINDSGQIVGRYYSPDCPGSCAFLATPAPSAPKVCDQSMTLDYANNTLTNHFSIATSTPLQWSVYLVALNTPIQLWTTPIPVVSPTLNFSVPLAGFPSVGPVFGLSILATPSGDAVCADFAYKNTGSAALAVR